MSSTLSKDTVEKAIQKLNKLEVEEESDIMDVSDDSQFDVHDYIKVLQFDDLPKISFSQNKNFSIDNGSVEDYFGTAEDKLQMFKQRYWMAYQKINRCDEFLKQFAIQKVTAVESLIGSTGRKIALGLLTKQAQDFFIEDLNSSVKLSFQNSVCSFLCILLNEHHLHFHSYNHMDFLWKENSLLWREYTTQIILLCKFYLFIYLHLKLEK